MVLEKCLDKVVLRAATFPFVKCYLSMNFTPFNPFGCWSLVTIWALKAFAAARIMESAIPMLEFMLMSAASIDNELVRSTIVVREIWAYAPVPSLHP